MLCYYYTTSATDAVSASVGDRRSGRTPADRHLVYDEVINWYSTVIHANAVPSHGHPRVIHLSTRTFFSSFPFGRGRLFISPGASEEPRPTTPVKNKHSYYPAPSHLYRIGAIPETRVSALPAPPLANPPVEIRTLTATLGLH